jgi:hypothetical protein
LCDQKLITNGVKQTMAQGILPFKYEEEKSDGGTTALGGLPLYLDLAAVIGLSQSIHRHLTIKKSSQGWTDSQFVLSGILLNIAGGSCVDDLNILNSDKGFCRILNSAENHKLHRRQRRELEQRWRKDKKRFIPSPSAMFRYLEAFHDPQQEQLRESVHKKAFIPAPNQHLRGLAKINGDVCAAMNKARPCKTATLDQDATLIETNKQAATHCYKGFKAYQPFNTWWAEHQMILHTEFRDGNVPAGHEQLRVFKEALRCLPQEVERVRLRSDTAGYQHELLRYCDSCEDKRFGKIEFSIGCDVTDAFKKAVAQVHEDQWRPIYKEVGDRKFKTGSQWAEVCFVPNKIGNKKTGLEYRYLAKRRVLEQTLPGMEDDQRELPFPTMEMKDTRYKVFGIVTNIPDQEMCGEDLIHWHHERCGKSEEVHSVMKKDLAGGTLPSGDFGENAAWWWMMILALNLNQMMKHLALKPEMVAKRMKAIRYSIINLPGRIIKRSRQLILRLSKGHPSFNILIAARKRIALMEGLPSG